MRGHYDLCSRMVNPQHDLFDRAGRRRVEARGRLVEEQDLRVQGPGAGGDEGDSMVRSPFPGGVRASARAAGLRELRMVLILLGMNEAPSIHYLVRPQPEDPRLTRRMSGIDHDGQEIETAVVVERPL